jgi:hypothetical protein
MSLARIPKQMNKDLDIDPKIGSILSILTSIILASLTIFPL